MSFKNEPLNNENNKGKQIKNIRIELDGADGEKLNCTVHYDDSSYDNVYTLDELNEKIEMMYIQTNINSLSKLMDRNWIFIPNIYRDNFSKKYKIENDRRIVKREIIKEAGQLSREDEDLINSIQEHIRGTLFGGITPLAENNEPINSIQLYFHRNRLVGRTMYSRGKPLRLESMIEINDELNKLYIQEGINSFDQLKEMNRITIASKDEALFKERYYIKDGVIIERQYKNLSVIYDYSGIYGILERYNGGEIKLRSLDEINEVLGEIYNERGTNSLSKLMDDGIVSIGGSKSCTIINDHTIGENRKKISPTSPNESNVRIIKELLLSFSGDKLVGTIKYDDEFNGSLGALRALDTLDDINMALAQLYDQTGAETYAELEMIMGKITYSGLEFEEMFNAKYKIKDNLAIVEKIDELTREESNFQARLANEQNGVQPVIQQTGPWINVGPNGAEPINPPQPIATQANPQPVVQQTDPQIGQQPQPRYQQNIHANPYIPPQNDGSQNHRGRRAGKIVALVILASAAVYCLYACVKGNSGDRLLENNDMPPEPTPPKYEANVEGDHYEGTFNTTEQDAIDAAHAKYLADEAAREEAEARERAEAEARARREALENARREAEAARKKAEEAAKKKENKKYVRNPNALTVDKIATASDAEDIMNVITDMTSSFNEFEFENLASEKDWDSVKTASDARNKALSNRSKQKAYANSLGEYLSGAEGVKFDGKTIELSYESLDEGDNWYFVRDAQALVTAGLMPSKYHGVVEERAKQVDDSYTIFIVRKVR